MAQKEDIQILRAYREELQHFYSTVEHLSEADCKPQDTPPPTSEEAEHVARLADDYGFDGSLFRNSTVNYHLGSVQHYNHLKRRIETIPKIIAAIERPIDNAAIPSDAELLTVPQVAKLLGWAEGTVRQRDREGLLPMPHRFGGTIQWNKAELEKWLEQGCPTRQKWEQIKGGK